MSVGSFKCGTRIGPIAAATLVVLMMLFGGAIPARAEITDTDWSLKISERELAFRPATDVMAMKTLMWDLPASRRAARNMPYVCLTNESDTASITQFKMTIGDDQFNFGNSVLGAYAKLGKDTPGFALSSSVEDGGDTLLVNFLNGGIAPGQTVNFQIDIDVDAAYADAFFVHPDYRTVLFDMNGDNYYQSAGIVHDESSDDNANVWIKFEMSGMSPVTVGPAAFEDPSVVDGSAGYVNSRMAHYGDSDPVRSFVLSGGSFIPEPGGLVLGMVAMIGLAITRRRSRRG